LVLVFAMASSVAFGVQQIVTPLALRHHLYDVLNRSRVVQGVGNAVLILVLVALPIAGYVALSLAFSISMVLGLIVILRGIPPTHTQRWRPTTHDWATTRREIGLQPVTNLLTGVTIQIPLIMFPVFAGAGLAGSWALSTRILAAGVTASYNSIQPIYYATAANYIRDGAYSRLQSWHRKWSLMLTAAAVPGFILAGLLIAYGLPLLGKEWEEARTLVVPACLFFGSVFLALPLSQTLLGVGRIRLQLIWTTVRFVAAVAAFALWPLWGPGGALWAWALVCSSSHLILVALQVRVLSGLSRRLDPAETGMR
jgi:O-antigen/teichoic acid export membrane protein